MVQGTSSGLPLSCFERTGNTSKVLHLQRSRALPASVQAVCHSKGSLRGQHLLFPIGNILQPGCERCTMGWYSSLALLDLQD